jgi:hypothetical protein
MAAFMYESREHRPHVTFYEKKSGRNEPDEESERKPDGSRSIDATSVRSCIVVADEFTNFSKGIENRGSGCRENFDQFKITSSLRRRKWQTFANG